MEGATLADTGGMGEGQKEGAVTMEDGLAEMHAQRPVSRSCHQVGRAIGWQSERQE